MRAAVRRAHHERGLNMLSTEPKKL